MLVVLGLIVDDWFISSKRGSAVGLVAWGRCWVAPFSDYGGRSSSPSDAWCPISASCFPVCFRWMSFSVSAESCMSVKSGGNLILWHVPSSGGFDNRWRLCDTYSSLVRILTCVSTTKYAWCDMALTGLGFGLRPTIVFSFALCVELSVLFVTCFWVLSFGLCTFNKF